MARIYGEIRPMTADYRIRLEEWQAHAYASIGAILANLLEFERPLEVAARLRQTAHELENHFFHDSLEQQSIALTPEAFEIIGAHSVAITIAAQLLAEASEKAQDSESEWLTLIMAKARSEYEACSPEELQDRLEKTLAALKGAI